MISLLKIISEIEKNKWEVIPSSELKKYKKEIFDLISTAYAPIGGHSNYKSPQDITSNEEYEVIDLDNDPYIDGVNISKKKIGGTKLVGIGHDGSKEAKRTLIKHKVDLLTKPGYYIEVSGKMLDILLANGLSPIDDKDLVQKVLQGKKIKWLGNGKYERSIGGKNHVKSLIGKPRV